MNTKLKPIVAALGLGLALLSGPSAAVVTLYSPLTGFEDDNVDFFLDATGTPDSFDVGDSLISVFEINQTFDATGSDSALIFPQELTGIAAVTLLRFDDLDGSGGNNDMVFGAYAPGLNSLLPGLVVTGGGAGGGAVAGLWLDDTPDLSTLGATNCTGQADCIAKATDGSLFEVDGFSAGDGDEFWIALNAQTDISAVAAGASSADFAAVNFGLSILDGGPNTYGLQDCTGGFSIFCANAALDPDNGPLDNMIGVIGSGSILGGAGLTNGAFAHSDFDFQKAPGEIPEPATLALLGLGLLGMGAVRRRV